MITMQEEPVRLERHDPPERLAGERGQTGVRTGFSHIGMFLFGLPFFLVGEYFVLGALGVRPLDMEKANVPTWVLGLVGVVFLMGGLMLWAMGYRAMRYRRQLVRSRRRYPDEPACADYPWDREGFVPDRWGKVLKALAMLPFFVAFLGVMNYVVFVVDGGAPLFAKAIAVLFDMIFLFALYRLGLMFLRAIKFGRSRLRFDRFPYRTGDTFPVRVELPTPLRRASGGRITLRQIEEYWEVTGRGKSRSKRIVHACGWSGVRVFGVDELQLGSALPEISFAIPTEASPTWIDAERPVFWEVELEITTPGVDFQGRYLVPVY